MNSACDRSECLGGKRAEKSVNCGGYGVRSRIEASLPLRDESFEESEKSKRGLISMSQRSGSLLFDGLTRVEIAIIEESLQEKTVTREVADVSAIEQET